MHNIDQFVMRAGSHTKETAVEIASKIATSLIRAAADSQQPGTKLVNTQQVIDVSCEIAVGIVTRLGLLKAE